jgi:ribosome recycling factor
MNPQIQSILKDTQSKFDKAMEFLKGEMKSLRSSRPSAELVEDIMIDSYGQKTPIKYVATITVSPPNSILIQPWDKANVEPICGAISKSSIGMQPIVDREFIRLNIPALSEERRKEILKVAGQKTEEAKISVRKIREEVLKHIKDLEDKKAISEDEMFSSKTKVQEIVDKYNKEIKETFDKKEQEIMTL